MQCSVIRILSQLPFCLVFLFEGLAFAFQEPSDSFTREPIDAALLIQTMREHAVRSPRNAIGGYVQRIYNDVSDSKFEANLESIRSAMEKAKETRISIEQKNNIKSDIDALNRQVAEDFASLKKQLAENQTTTTIAVRFTQQKHEYRVEQFDLNHEDTLEKLASDSALEEQALSQTTLERGMAKSMRNYSWIKGQRVRRQNRKSEMDRSLPWGTRTKQVTLLGLRD